MWIPLNHPFLKGFSMINIDKSCILDYPHDYGNPHIRSIRHVAITNSQRHRSLPGHTFGD